MTAIVAWTDGKKNYLAADGRSVCGDTISTDDYPKITRMGEYYIACAGFARAQQLINLAIERGVEFTESPLELCEWVKALLDGDGWVVDESDGARSYRCFRAILVGPGGVFEIDPAFCATRADDRISWIGSGGSDAAAALYALEELGSTATPEERAEIALRCASRVSTGVGGVMRFVSVDCAP